MQTTPISDIEHVQQLLDAGFPATAMKPSFTEAVLELLPEKIAVDNTNRRRSRGPDGKLTHFAFYRLRISKYLSMWIVRYEREGGTTLDEIGQTIKFKDASLLCAASAMWCYLKTNNLLPTS